MFVFRKIWHALFSSWAQNVNEMYIECRMAYYHSMYILCPGIVTL